MSISSMAKSSVIDETYDEMATKLGPPIINKFKNCEKEPKMKDRRSVFGWETITIIILFTVGLNLSFATPVQAKWPTVIFPSAEGITLVEGNTYTILWESVRVDPVTIALCTEEPGYSDCFYAIAMGVPNSGSYSWTVPSDLPYYSSYSILVGLIGASVGGSDYPFIISDSVLDSDSDGIPDDSDNCPTTSNTNQTDIDFDGVGDACDQDLNAIDNDGDGYTENQGDCDDSDNSINPGATEVCGDGIDQDCDGFDAECSNNVEPGFHYQSYLAANPDLPQTWGKAGCMSHYILYGFYGKRAVAFNIDEYLNANSDLPTNWAFEEGLAHYNVFGKYENRLLAFDAQEYLSLYPDLPQDWTYDQAYQHFLYFGQYEGRIASFDEVAYLEMYPDLPSSWGQTESFFHYLNYGQYEGRVYDPYDESVFSPAD